MTHTTSAGTPALAAENLAVGYGERRVIADFSIEVPDGGFVAVIGPNGCGKSTLLKTLARVIRPSAGRVVLGGEPVAHMRPRQAALRMSFLPQSPIAVDGITVRALVARGRHPHHTLLRQGGSDDNDAIATALERTGLSELAGEQLASLSGGQRQRAWVAMVLAQDTRVILLDEPTTFLDIAHQYELLGLFARLNAEGRTIVTVLHDLNQAARFASSLVVMKDGAVQATGAPSEVLTPALLADVFGLAADVIPDPRTGTPLVIPHARPLG